MRHPTVPLLYAPPPDSEPWPWGPGTEPRLVDIDEGLADLILGLWAAGIDTSNCCQGGLIDGKVLHSQKAVICFGRVDDARRFMRMTLDARRHMTTRRPISFDRWTAADWYESIHYNYDSNPGVCFPPGEIAELEARARWWRSWAAAPWYQPALTAT